MEPFEHVRNMRYIRLSILVWRFLEAEKADSEKTVGVEGLVNAGHPSVSSEWKCHHLFQLFLDTKMGLFSQRNRFIRNS